MGFVMKMSTFAVVHARGNVPNFIGDPLIHCYAGKQLVLAYVSRQALMDYFRIPGDKHVTVQQWNLVVDRNLDAFKRIIEDKFDRDDWDVHNSYGQSYPKLVVTLEDMRHSGEKFTIKVLGLDAGFWRRA